MNAKATYISCKTFATAYSLCLAMDKWSLSDLFLDAIYDTLLGIDTSQQLVSAQVLLALNNYGYLEFEEENMSIPDDESFTGFAGWLTEQLDTFTLPLSEFIGIMRFAVKYLSEHPTMELLELNDLVSEGFVDAVLSNGSVTFVTFKENLVAVYNLIKGV